MSEELISKESLRIAVLDTDWNDDTDADVALDMIDGMKAVKAKEVVRARWKKGGLWNNHREFFCSNPKCGQSVFNADDFNFCPYCGAEMGKVSENENI